MEAGDHGSTYGGNPLACTAVKTVIDIFQKEQIVDHVKEMGEYLSTCLEKLVQKYDFVKECRGKGLIQGIELTKPAGDIITKAHEAGLLIITAKGNTIRFVPPLIITKEQIDEMIEKLEIAFA